MQLFHGNGYVVPKKKRNGYPDTALGTYLGTLRRGESSPEKNCGNVVGSLGMYSTSVRARYQNMYLGTCRDHFSVMTINNSFPPLTTISDLDQDGPTVPVHLTHASASKGSRIRCAASKSSHKEQCAVSVSVSVPAHAQMMCRGARPELRQPWPGPGSGRVRVTKCHEHARPGHA